MNCYFSFTLVFSLGLPPYVSGKLLKFERLLFVKSLNMSDESLFF